MQKVQKVQTVQKNAKMRLHPFSIHERCKMCKKKSAFAHFPALPGRIDLCPGLHWIELSHKLK